MGQDFIFNNQNTRDIINPVLSYQGKTLKIFYLIAYKIQTASRRSEPTHVPL
jgi:hypothetical protein